MRQQQHPHHHNCVIKIGKNILVFIMAGVYAMQYLNAFCEENNSDLFSPQNLRNSREMQAFLVMACLFHISQIIEIHDHMPGSHDHHDSVKLIHAQDNIEEKIMEPVIEDHQENMTIEIKPKTKCGIAIRCVGGLVAAGLAGCASYALWVQSNSLCRENYGLSIPVFMFSMLRFVLLPVRHMASIICGTEEKLLHEVVHTKNAKKTSKLSISPYTKVGLFVLYTGCHLGDSFLLANQLNDSYIYWLCTFGLSISVASYHFTHTIHLKTVLDELGNLRNKREKILALSLGLCMGALHTSQSVLGFMLLMKKNKWLLIPQTSAIMVEFASGTVDAIQHIGLWAAKRSDQYQNFNEQKDCLSAVKSLCFSVQDEQQNLLLKS